MPTDTQPRYYGNGMPKAVDQLIAFANVKLSREVWSDLMSKPQGYAWQRRLEWIFWTIDHRRAFPKNDRGFREAKRLQREVQEVLRAIIARDPRPLSNHFKRAGALRHGISWGESLQSKRGKSQPKTWNLFRIPQGAGIQYLRQVITIWIVDTLPFTERLGRCDHCEEFFLSQRARPHRFCSEPCSTRFHNKRRLSEGYFTKRRRAKREAQSSS
jgi:hypothetical protein